ncbi:establishment of centrosome localization, variant 2 [Batrachochytrium dendrobatidis]
MDHIRAKMESTSDMEVLRLQIQNELEQSQKSKWVLLSKENDKYRDLYYKSKREVESLYLDKDQLNSRHAREIKEIHIAKLEEVKQWEARFLTLQQSLDAESDTERLRIVQREKVELELKTTMLLSELDEVRAEKEQLRLDYEQNLRSHKRQLAEQLGEAKVLQTEKDSLQANVASLEQELSKTLRHQDDLTAECISLKKELDKTKSRMEENTHQFNVNISDMKMTVLKERTENQNVVGDLKDKIVELKSSIKTLNSTIQDMSHKICHSEKEHMEKCRLIREEEWAKLSTLESEKADIERSLEVFKQRLSELHNRDESFRQQTSTEQDRLKAEIRELTSNQESLNSMNKSLISERDNFQSECNHLQSRCLEIDTMLSTANSSLEDYKQKLNSQHQKTTLLEQSVKNHILDLELLQDQSNKEREALMHDLERQKSFLLQERLQSAKKIESLSQDNLKNREKAAKLCNVLEQQDQRYGSKLESFKNKIRAYKTEVQTLKQSLDTQIKLAGTQQEEMHRRQTGFMSFLQSEGI